jgi:hypothetical protein
MGITGKTLLKANSKTDAHEPEVDGEASDQYGLRAIVIAKHILARHRMLICEIKMVTESLSQGQSPEVKKCVARLRTAIGKSNN